MRCIPGDPAITFPVLFKGSCSPLSLALLYVAYCTLRPYLVRRVLSVLLAVLCYACGYGIIYPSSGLCGPIFIYYKRALRVCGCMRSLRV